MSALKDKIDNAIEALCKMTDEATISAELQHFLTAMATFHQYSFHNSWLIVAQCPSATIVAGYNKWLSLHRYVRRGEKGIAILAPVLTKVEGKDETTNVLVGFRQAYVFDISQTEGEPLPEPPNWKSPEMNAELQKRLVAYAEELKIDVVVHELSGDTQGATMRGKIVVDPNAGTKTLIHEIAHALMHENGDKSTQKSREVEAESVAYVVGVHFGLEGLASPNYIALWQGDSGDIKHSLRTIRSTAARIITALEGGEYAGESAEQI